MNHVRVLADHIGPRPAGSEDAARARRYIMQVVRDLGFLPEVQPFFVTVPRCDACRLTTEAGRVIPCLPAIGSATTPAPLQGVPRPLRPVSSAAPRAHGNSNGVFLLCPVGSHTGSDYVRFAAEQGARAILLYHDGVPDLYSEVLPDCDWRVPAVTIRRTDALWLQAERPVLRLTLTRTRVKSSCSNIIVEVGQGGRPLLFLAHYDTRPWSPGALRNASGVAALLDLLSRMQGWSGPRAVLGFLDAEEFDAAGSRHCRDTFRAVGTLRNPRGVVYVSRFGLRGIAAVPEAPSWEPSILRVARGFAGEEGLLLPEEVIEPGDALVPPRVWPHATIALSGPSVAVQHTSADRPSLLHPEFLSRAVAVLERLARAA